MNIAEAVRQYKAHDKQCVESIKKVGIASFHNRELLGKISVIKNNTVLDWKGLPGEKIVDILSKSIKLIVRLNESIQGSSDIAKIEQVAKKLIKLRHLTSAKIHKLYVIEQKKQIKKYLIR